MKNMKSHWYDCVINQVQLGITQKKLLVTMTAQLLFCALNSAPRNNRLWPDVLFFSDPTCERKCINYWNQQ